MTLLPSPMGMNDFFSVYIVTFFEKNVNLSRIESFMTRSRRDPRSGALLSIYTYPSSAKLGGQSSNRSIPVAAAKTPKKPAITSGCAVDKISTKSFQPCVLACSLAHFQNFYRRQLQPLPQIGMFNIVWRKYSIPVICGYIRIGIFAEK